ncbi:MAG TPA: hypothetical protein VK509_23760 [Polyangiales bacterium]|nr:hypothetical protein [Polyangiales bacterium]
MGFSKSFSARCSIALAFVALGASACSSEPEEDDSPNMGAGRDALPPLMVNNAASGGAAAGSAGVVATPSAGIGASGASAAGTGGSSAGTGGSSAGAGGSAGSTAMMAGSGTAGASVDAGVPDEEDPFGGLLGPAEVSCEGLLCLEDADCATLYPEENATCKFTSCADFMCM